MKYNDKLSAEDQIDMEEWIADFLFGSGYGKSEEESARFGKMILHNVLIKFRPDLFDSKKFNYQEWYDSTK